MHRRMTKKTIMTAMVLIMALLTLTTGCAGKAKGRGEDLVCLTDGGSEEAPEEKESQEGQDKSADQDVKDTNDGYDTAGTKEEAAETFQNSGIIYVHVCGQVAEPGVYALPQGSRLYEAIEAAGGILENGVGEMLNQAEQVGDGQQIYVPSKEEVSQLKEGAYTAHQGLAGGGNAAAQGSSEGWNSASQEAEGKLNLNTASKEQLMTLSGIGERKAESIIAYREEHGGFQKIEELMEVEGIKEGVFNKVRDRISIN